MFMTPDKSNIPITLDVYSLSDLSKYSTLLPSISEQHPFIKINIYVGNIYTRDLSLIALNSILILDFKYSKFSTGDVLFNEIKCRKLIINNLNYISSRSNLYAFGSIRTEDDYILFKNCYFYNSYSYALSLNKWTLTYYYNFLNYNGSIVHFEFCYFYFYVENSDTYTGVSNHAVEHIISFFNSYWSISLKNTIFDIRTYLKCNGYQRVSSSNVTLNSKIVNAGNSVFKRTHAYSVGAGGKCTFSTDMQSIPEMSSDNTHNYFKDESWLNSKLLVVDLDLGKWMGFSYENYDIYYKYIIGEDRMNKYSILDAQYLNENIYVDTSLIDDVDNVYILYEVEIYETTDLVERNTSIIPTTLQNNLTSIIIM